MTGPGIEILPSTTFTYNNYTKPCEILRENYFLKPTMQDRMVTKTTAFTRTSLLPGYRNVDKYQTKYLEMSENLSQQLRIYFKIKL